MLISPAFAEEVATATDTAATTSAAGGSFISMLPILLVIVVFYFMVIRPQSARIREHKKMVQDLAPGIKVITGGGLVASVVKLVGNDEVVLKLAENVEVTAMRSSIMMLRTPPEQK